MKKLLFVFLLAAFALCMSAATAMAQSTGGVTGTVKDTTGAEQETTTNDQGVYTFPKAAPGTGYTLTFTNAGFQTLLIKDVAIGVGIVETHNAELTIGEVSGTVEVTASNEATLNTT